MSEFEGGYDSDVSYDNGAETSFDTSPDTTDTGALDFSDDMDTGMDFYGFEAISDDIDIEDIGSIESESLQETGTMSDAEIFEIQQSLEGGAEFVPETKPDLAPEDLPEDVTPGPIFPAEPPPVNPKDFEGRNPEYLLTPEEFPTGGAAAGVTGDAADDTTAATFDAVSDNTADDGLSSDFVEMEENEQYDLHPEDRSAIQEPVNEDLSESSGMSEQGILEGQQVLDTNTTQIPDVENATEILQTEDIPAATAGYPTLTPEDIQHDINENNAEIEHDAALLECDTLDEVLEEGHIDTIETNTPEDYATGLPGAQEELEEPDATDETLLETGIPEALFVPETDIIDETEESENQEEPVPIENLTDVVEEIDISDINDDKNYFEDNERITGILGDFKQETWDNKDINDQKATIEKLADYNADVLGVENKPRIEYYNNPDKSDFGASGKDFEGNPIIRINEYALGDSKETADTIAHEYRHVYQNERAALGQNDLDNRYRDNLNSDNYVQAQEDFDGYKNQLVERDARAYARGFKDLIKNL